MKRVRWLTPLVLFLFLPTSPLDAQRWTPEQQAVLDFTKSCWDTWQREEVDRYLADCWDDDITFWFSEFTLPFGKEWVKTAGSGWLARTEVVALTIQPHTVKADGEVAVIHYQILEASDGTNGAWEVGAVARTDVLRRRAGQWRVIAVHQHQAPASRNR